MFRLITIILFFLFVSFSSADTLDERFTECNITALKNCIISENDGIRSWGVFFAGKYRIKESVNCLIEVLKNDKNKEIRKLAAYALFRIDDSEGVESLKEIADSDESNSLRELCSSLYYAAVSPVLIYQF